MSPPAYQKKKTPSRTKEVVAGLSGASVLSVVAVGLGGLPVLATLPIAWAGAAYATRNPRNTSHVHPTLTAGTVGVLGTGIALGMGVAELLPSLAGVGFAAGACIPLLNEAWNRRLASQCNTSGAQERKVIVEHRPPRPGR